MHADVIAGRQINQTWNYIIMKFYERIYKSTMQKLISHVID